MVFGYTHRMTKFQITYLKAQPEMMTVWPMRAVVTLEASTLEEAAFILATKGGFHNELPDDGYIAAGAILAIELLQ